MHEHGAFNVKEVEKLRQQPPDAIGKIDEILAEENIRGILVRIASSLDVIEEVVEALNKSPDFKTRIKTIELLISQNQENNKCLVAYTHLRDDVDTLRKIDDLLATNEEVRRSLFENTTTSTARDGDCGLIPERPPNKTRKSGNSNESSAYTVAPVQMARV